MKNMSLYNKAHLLISASRVIEYQNNGFPSSVKQISELLNISQEEILFVLRKLEENSIVNIIEKDHNFKVSIEDHTSIENLPKEKQAAKLDSELKNFKEKQKNKTKEIEEFQKKQKEKQKLLFEKLNKDLKNKKD
jgi:DNA-binding Lrp family transcriptional regulator